MKTPIRFLFVLLSLALVSACSHLHVDLDSHWRLSQDARVAVVVEQPPTEIRVSQVTDAVYNLGWQPADGSSPADAQLLCRWQRVVDLTDDSEPTKTIKSFHAKIINAQNGQLLGVADYFYADGELDLWTGVETALNQLYAQITVAPVVTEPVAAKPVVAKPVVAEPVVAEPVVAEPVVAEPVVAEPVVAEPVVAEPTVAEPTVAEPTVAEPTVAEPTVAEPTDSISSAIDNTSSSTSGVIYQPQATGSPVNDDDQGDLEELESPQTMEKSPWIPRFQGMGLENWGKEEPLMD
ncbi:hypothetical protein HTZ97_11565 [Desulfuromonas acetoxidans]|uniref:hypothetical protein n=1 Tax=Desulfuromonas acetoxidans TaxID=891 RepID=UPI001594D35A|nr:hypothetical protein [Desulfuromonas acetoxidans]NVD25059.1 hypothetical protein [Desulfuromonas acetoxidans]NVE17104.1 hypothetical protein [Desulfuromonas acetoxidans]